MSLRWEGFGEGGTNLGKWQREDPAVSDVASLLTPLLHACRKALLLIIIWYSLTSALAFKAYHKSLLCVDDMSRRYTSLSPSLAGSRPAKHAVLA